MTDVDYLKIALETAEKYRGFCAPNPAVGAVLVKNGEIIAKSAHKGAGLAHAEAEVLSRVSENQIEGATLYVTLEPCCHWGKTPPCTQLIMANRIKRVVYAYTDPNPTVGGKGAEELRSSSVDIEKVTLPEIDKFYESYSYWIRTKRPFVTAKLAMSLDGKVAGPQGVQVAISRESINGFTHQMRRRTDAILTTARTVSMDNPSLNARVGDQVVPKTVYILDRKLSLSPELNVFKTAESVTLFHESEASKKTIESLTNEGVQCVPVSSTDFGLNMKEVLEFIGEQGQHDLWVEAGGRLFQSLVDQGLINRSLIYVCPVWLGDQALSAFDNSGGDLFKKASRVKWIPVGRDSLCEIVW